MHPNPAFRRTEEETALAFARARGFGVMTAAGPEGVLAAHVPFVLEGRRLAAHLVRSNPLARHLRQGPSHVRLIVSGPDGYISPDWYGVEDKVPTWNYVAVHLTGALSLAPEAGLLGHLEALSARFEGRLEKPPWTHEKMSDGVMAKMMRQILPVSMEIAGVESTFKLNQNQPDAARQGAAAALEAGGTPGMETAALAGLMRGLSHE
ncbi:MAG: FMN-binding negative transcriptional regulator [Pseudomonadota bacterium]